MKRLLSLSVGCAGALLSCAGLPALRAAQSGDRAALSTALVAREKAGELTNAEATTLARAVAERELRTAAGPEAVDRVRDGRPCAHELDAALAARSAAGDAAAAEAALARLEARALDPDDARSHLADASSSWRAVGARGLVRASDQPARARALLDPDPAVRRAAARAAREARDPADRTPLADAARRDPEPLVRTEAVRSLAVLPATPDGSTAEVLRDLWIAGDDGLREDIAVAWSSADVWDAGGREALRVIIASDEGPGAVEAAAAVLRRRAAPPELAGSAIAQLVRAMGHGTTALRSQALAESPAHSKELRPLFAELADSDDAELRVGALARLAEEKDARAVEKLEALAQPGFCRRRPCAARARQRRRSPCAGLDRERFRGAGSRRAPGCGHGARRARRRGARGPVAGGRRRARPDARRLHDPDFGAQAVNAACPSPG